MGSEPKHPTAEEKAARKAAKVGELRDRLRGDYDVLNLKLARGGDFRDGEDMMDELWLCRWLRARNWSVDKAEECVRAHAAWREEFMPRGRVLETEIPNELAAEKMFLQGVDVNGRGVLVFLAKNHWAWTRYIEELERSAVYCIDALISAADPALNPDRTMTFVFDLTDFGVSNVDLTAMVKLFHIINNHFVERLGRCFIYNAGSVFENSWKLFSPMLDEITLKKISFLGLRQWGVLHAEVPREVLPEHLGGTGRLVPVSEAVAKRRLRQTSFS
ncbi:unnamed protein product [Ostreobium quekettii]|uniref:CRAL-TRIO domain-containing protein n=1 Tax=Ostreobium quekettii TaxID=121088 RepID=A0A8S1J948_9CHLO|nr:unnamed protein product [Ostreobium quekettii]